LYSPLLAVDDDSTCNVFVDRC